jgi:hypothetical protein
MGEQWDPWNQGPQQGGRWGPPGGDGRGGTPPAGGGFAPGGFTPGGFTPGGSPSDRFPTGRPADEPAFGGFGSPQLADDDLVGAPPKIWLIAALVLGLAAFAVALVLGASIGYAFAAWLLAGPVAIGLLAVFAQRDVRQRALPIYGAPGWLPALYWSAVVAAGLGVCAGAVRIALWAGNL